MSNKQNRGAAARPVDGSGRLGQRLRHMTSLSVAIATSNCDGRRPRSTLTHQSAAALPRQPKRWEKEEKTKTGAKADTKAERGGGGEDAAPAGVTDFDSPNNNGRQKLASCCSLRHPPRTVSRCRPKQTAGTVQTHPTAAAHRHRLKMSLPVRR